MDMAATMHEQKIFFATGRRQEGVEAIAALGLRPALFAGYRDLSLLRHDFPLVLVADSSGATTIRSLSDIVDEMLLDGAPRGIAGERLRKHALALEREIRQRIAAGDTGLLSELWATAAERVNVDSDEISPEVLRYTTGALQLDGEVVGCVEAMPARFLAHLWEAAHAAKGRAFRQAVDTLVVRLTDILRAAFIHSAAGQQPAALRASVGGAHQDMFDFSVMSRLVGRGAPKDELPSERRRRIEGALAVLQGQHFFTDPNAPPSPDAIIPFEFRFEDCAAAVEAFRARLPALVDTVRAMSIAELEAGGRYREAEHGPFFESFSDHALTPDDLALFPDYLVCIPPDRNAAPENANLIEMLSSGLPVKVLVETRDLLEESAVGAGHFAFGVRSVRLGMTAMGLGGVFVVQTPSSNLLALHGPIAKGLGHRGPALFSVFSGTGDPAANVSPYLTAAAAIESRAFPPFAYDPQAGDNLAARFSLVNCPQPEVDWPVECFDYADEAWQRVTEHVAFTFADFVLCDRRRAPHFARVDRARWNTQQRPVAEWLALDAREAADCVPYVLAIDADDVLHRVLVDAQLIGAVRRCRTLWHRLREQGGVHNSHAEALLARERAVWEAEKQRQFEALKAAATPVAGSPAQAPAAYGRARRRCACRRCGSGGRSRALPGRNMDRDRALPQLQRMPAHQRPDVPLQREQAGLHGRSQGRHVSPARRGCGKLPGIDHPSGQASRSERARPRRIDGARQGVSVAIHIRLLRTRDSCPIPLPSGTPNTSTSPRSSTCWKRSSSSFTAASRRTTI